MEVIMGRLVRGKARREQKEGGHERYMAVTCMDHETGINYRMNVDQYVPLEALEKLQPGEIVDLDVSWFSRPCKRERGDGTLYDTNLYEPVVVRQGVVQTATKPRVAAAAS